MAGELKRSETLQTRASAFLVFAMVLRVLEVTGNTTARYLGRECYSHSRKSQAYYNSYGVTER